MVRATAESAVQRRRIEIRGAVQGVGFRPFVYRLASELGLAGWVSNSTQGVIVEAEGAHAALDELVRRIIDDRPPRSLITGLIATPCLLQNSIGFTVAPSDGGGAKSTIILPDIAVCDDCLREVFDPTNRRFHYPFINCTNCGPRYSIIESLPYDRGNTTMRAFTMCLACQAEYENPLDRRFHAQPNACPDCGPRLQYWNAAGAVEADQDEALLRAVAAIREGMIVAIKGLGGFHVMVDARSEEAVRRLRRRKAREEKPLAVMFPNLQDVRSTCLVSAEEEALLRSPEAPIVLLRHLAAARREIAVASSVAPGNPYSGVLLPYTPLHHLLLAGLGFPVVATSGNVCDEPICIDEHEAVARLGTIADAFLVHNRPIARQVDDSVLRIVRGRTTLIRRSRGFAPLPITVRPPLPPILATGGHLKTTLAITVGNDVVLSQHIGDLDTPQALAAYEKCAADLTRLYVLQPETIVRDAHPDYASTHWADHQGCTIVTVQHHYAHVLGCMAEHELKAPVLGIAWDGTGYGPDGTIWGGEFLLVCPESYERVAHMRTFALPGGERAVREPRRSALGLLYEIFGDSVIEMTNFASLQAFSSAERTVLLQMLRGGLNAPRTSSVGRLFDAVASLVDLRQIAGFEGQPAMELEYAADGYEANLAYPFLLCDDRGPYVVDWEPAIRTLLRDREAGISIGQISARWHAGLAAAAAEVARRVGIDRVVLSGGCFQNVSLLEKTIDALEEAGYRVFWPERVPANDGGLALGQVVAGALSLATPSASHPPRAGEGDS
jgi:hydrogenase maturation protein HypF